MSIRVTSRVWDQSKQENSALLLLLAFADHANDDGVSWPKIDQLARKAREGERQTTRLIRRLEASGELYVATGGGRGRGNTYMVLTGLNAEQIAAALVDAFKLSADEAMAIALEKVSKMTGKVIETLSKSTPFEKEKVTSRAVKGDIQGKEKVTSRAKAPSIQPTPKAQTAPLTVTPKRHEPSKEGTAPTPNLTNHPAVAYWSATFQRQLSPPFQQALAGCTNMAALEKTAADYLAHPGWNPSNQEAVLDRYGKYLRQPAQPPPVADQVQALKQRVDDLDRQLEAARGDSGQTDSLTRIRRKVYDQLQEAKHRAQQQQHSAMAA